MGLWGGHQGGGEAEERGGKLNEEYFIFQL